MSNLIAHQTHVIGYLFSALLVLLHFLYAFYTWFADQTIFTQTDPWRDRSIDRYNKYRLKKKPNHLVISVCQEEVFYDYLAKLLAWALFLEIPVVSFYHHENGNNMFILCLIRVVCISRHRFLCFVYNC